jgi:hypothetical protein
MTILIDNRSSAFASINDATSFASSCLERLLRRPELASKAWVLLTAGLTILCTAAPARADGAVHATVFVTIGGGQPSGSDNATFAVPDFEASLFDAGNVPRFTARSDHNGRLVFSAVPSGTYRLCWRTRGWLPGCAPDAIDLVSGVYVLPGIDVRPVVERGPDGSVTRGPLWGRVTLYDGSSAYERNEFLRIDQAVDVALLQPSGSTLTQKRLGPNGYFIFVDAPASATSLRAATGNVTSTAAISTNARNGAPIDVRLAFGKPTIDAIRTTALPEFALADAARRRVVLSVQANDPRGEQLTYEWHPAPGSGRIISSDGSTAVWEPSPVSGRQDVYSVVRNASGAVSSRVLSTNITQTSALAITCPQPAPPTSGPGAVNRTMFLSYYEPSSDAQAQAYYKALDPQMSFSNSWTGGTHSNLKDWLAQAGFAPNAPAGGGIDHSTSEQVAYLNHNDLGFGRRMTVRINANNGTVYAFVTNFGQPDQCPQNADDAKANNSPGATVAMEYSPLQGVSGSVIKFFVYGPSADPATAGLVNSANLDNNGPKYVPNLCVTCHGGQALDPSVTTLTPEQASLRYDPTNASTGPHFREFDLASFRYPSGTATDPNTNVPTDTTLLAAFKTLNDFVLRTNPTNAMSEIINKWYANSSPPYDASAVPGGWSAHPNLYQDVVARSCRTCHLAIGNTVGGSAAIDWATYDSFKRYRQTIRSFVCAGPGARQMPHALMTYVNFWLGGKEPNELGAFSAADWAAFGGCN